MKVEYKIFNKTGTDAELIDKITNKFGVKIESQKKGIDFTKVTADCLQAKMCYEILKMVEEHNTTEIRKEVNGVITYYYRTFWNIVLIVIIIISFYYLFIR